MSYGRCRCSKVSCKCLYSSCVSSPVARIAFITIVLEDHRQLSRVKALTRRKRLLDEIRSIGIEEKQRNCWR
jgi:hypothetical protein